jgi:phosphatidylethanolamine/phosphatidyl-N-methylethanolamine N-methyltransferase
MRPDAVTASYRRWAPFYDASFGAFTRRGRRLAVEAVNRRAGSVLEVGVGTGLALGHYAPHLAVTGVDYSAEMLARAQEKVDRLGLAQVAALRRMDARALDFPDASFDTVVAMHVISVVPEPERVMAEMARVCRPGGQVIVLSHFLHDTGLLGWLGRRAAPLADQLGWHSDFTAEPVLACPGLAVVEERPSPPFGMFTRLTLERDGGRKAAGEPVVTNG